MHESPVTFVSRDAVVLEGLLEKGTNKGAVVLLHPHPLYGGEMRNPVIKALKKAASEEGFTTLRFNFRGVGKSEGSYGEGIKEKEDLKGALDYLSSLGAERPFVVAGYSFGSIVAARTSREDQRIDMLVLVSPPLLMDGFEEVMAFKGPKLVIVGDRDDLCPLEKLEQWYRDLPEPKRLHIVESCDHFYSWGMHIAVTNPFKEFLRVFCGGNVS